MAWIGSAVRCGSAPLATRQNDSLQSLIAKHLEDPAFAEFAHSEDFTATSVDRGIQRWEHSHLVAALDTLNSYQRDRRARSNLHVNGHRLPMKRSFRHDPRTKLIELLKRWLRLHAASTQVQEDEVRSICNFCRDLLNHPGLFPSRNPRSFLRTIAEVYDHLQWQLRDVLEKDRSCADLAQRALTLSRNLVSDALGFLMLAATDLAQTDALPSLEVVALWQSLPEPHPLPGRSDQKLQRTMRQAWSTRCGTLIATLLSTPWCLRLFDGAVAEEEAAASIEDKINGDKLPTVPELITWMHEDFQKGHFKGCGLAGLLRNPANSDARNRYLDTFEVVFSLTFLLGQVLVQFQRISDGLGDYGMIRVAPWLHPFLQALIEKVQKLKSNMELLSKFVDGSLVLARARGISVEKPAPTDRMSARAHACIERAVVGRQSHAALLTQALEELRARSAPERLPNVMEGLGDACVQLHTVMSSEVFRACVGDSFPELPSLLMSPSTPSPHKAAFAVDDTVELETVSTVDSLTMATRETTATTDMDQEPRSPPYGDFTGAAHGELKCGEGSTPEETVAITDDSLQPEKPCETEHPVEGDVPVYGKYNPAASFPGCPSVSVTSVTPRKIIESHERSPFGSGLPTSDGEAPTVYGKYSPAAFVPRCPNLGAIASKITTTHTQADPQPAISCETEVPRCRGRSPGVFERYSPAALISRRPSFGSRAATPPASEEEPVSEMSRPGEEPSMFGRYSPAAFIPSSTYLPRKLNLSGVPPRMPRGRSVPAPSKRRETQEPSRDELRAEVYRLAETVGGHGYRRHDRRSLMLSGKRLFVYEKGSTARVKAVVEARDVTDCSMLPGDLLSIDIRRRCQKGMDMEMKCYIFEFLVPSMASAFHAEIAPWAASY
eukprot:CAMPEP_0194515232 /NCGR_PEP_ID=MMETSP0253-20130528/47855_1 /TAXON_ID=2966 /ORGANISM="Noctiluca scintillans" /LENGTH=892 /DNA_ID=CAMNT_0039358963 /DNA_START=30 /DNA_END=2708 /DNA_ORIENTATION=+